MTKRSIDKNWKKLLADGVVTHKKKKVGPIDYEKKTKNGKKTIWFDVDKDVLEASRISSKEALVPDKSKAGNYSKLAALDCEMVGVGYLGKKSVLARATLVAGNGDILIDEFCKATEKVTDYRTVVSGVRYKDIAKAQKFTELQAKVKEAIAGKILVGHGISNDLKALKLSHPAKDIRDTANYFRLESGGKPGLAQLSEERLGIKIQTGEHSPVVDARAALRLYLQVRRQWEEKFKDRKKEKIERKIAQSKGKTETENDDESDNEPIEDFGENE